MRDTADILVIGAGPAGSLVALLCARQGARVLLVDKQSFGRAKVCGGCLNRRALAALAGCGLGGLPDALGARPTDRLQWWAAGRRAELPLPEGRALSRQCLDAALVDEASGAGATCRDGVAARVCPDGAVSLSDGRTLRPRCVVVADGLAGRALEDHPGFNQRVRPAARIGLGAVLDTAGATPEGVVRMACGGGGYVGAVRVESGRLDVAAAVSPAAVRRHGGPAGVVAALLEQAGAPMPPALAAARWRGTPKLTRQRTPLWGHRLFVVGDAAGYIEPFTGEGMAWAMSSARALAPLALQAADRWDNELGRAWRARHHAIVRRRQWACRAAAALLRRPRATAAVVRVLAGMPRLSAPVLGHLNRPATT